MIPQIHSGNFIEKEGRLWMTAEMIGSHLDFSEPRKSVNKIYERNRAELDPLSTVVKLTSVDKRKRKVRIFDEDGCLIIAMKANTPTARRFRIALAKFINHLRSQQVEYVQLQEQLDAMRIKAAKAKLARFYKSSPAFKNAARIKRLLELREVLSVEELARVFQVSKTHINKALRLYRQSNGDFGDHRPKNLMTGGGDDK